MKSIKFFFACVLALTFVACSNAESDSFEDNSSNFESMISLYGIQSATVDSKVGDDIYCISCCRLVVLS